MKLRTVFAGIAACLTLVAMASAQDASTHSPAAHADPVRVAVGAFETAGVDDNLAVALRPFLVRELAVSPRIDVVEDERLDDALEYIELQHSGLCDEDKCAVEPGKFLNAQKIITGALGKLGAKYTLSLSVIDVQTLRVEFTDTAECACTEEQLDKTMTQLGARVRRRLESGTAPMGAAMESDVCPDGMAYLAATNSCIERRYRVVKSGEPEPPISFNDARKSCANDGRRLPRADEWTAACESAGALGVQWRPDDQDEYIAAREHVLHKQPLSGRKGGHIATCQIVDKVAHSRTVSLMVRGRATGFRCAADAGATPDAKTDAPGARRGPFKIFDRLRRK